MTGLLTSLNWRPLDPPLSQQLVFPSMMEDVTQIVTMNVQPPQEEDLEEELSRVSKTFNQIHLHSKFKQKSFFENLNFKIGWSIE